MNFKTRIQQILLLTIYIVKTLAAVEDAQNYKKLDPDITTTTILTNDEYVLYDTQNFSEFDHHWLQKTVLSNDGTVIRSHDLPIRSRRSDDNKFINSSTVTNVTEVHEYSEAFKKCSSYSEVEPEYYEILSNGSAFVPVYNRTFNKTDYSFYNEYLIICPHFFDDHPSTDHENEAKYDESLEIVSQVGAAISFIFIILHMIMFFVFPKLRNLPGYSLFSLCISLFIAYAVIFATFLKSEDTDCTAAGMIKAYGFLASYFWMNVISYDIFRSLRLATRLRVTTNQPLLVRFSIYSAYSWGMPFLIMMSALIINKQDVSIYYKPVIEINTCWFHYRQALLIYFAVPFFILFSINIIFFMFSFYMIHRGTMNTSENKTDLWSRFMIAIRLSVAMGLKAIFAVAATAFDANWMMYLYAFCDMLQGVFIFFSFSVTKNNRKLVMNVLTKKRSTMFTTNASSQRSTVV